MLPLRAVALLFLFASSSISEPIRNSRSSGFHHASSFGSEFSKSFSSSGFGSQGLASEPVVQTKASYKGCSSATGCGGITLENGKITEKFGNTAAIGLNGDVPDNIDPSELHKKFALQAADINSAFAGTIPVNGPFWWASKDSPFKDTYETYLKWVKDNSFAAAPFTSPCGTSTCPFGSSFSSQNKIPSIGINNALDISNNPFLNGQFAAGFGGSGFTSGSGVDVSKNPFLSDGQHGGAHGGSNSFSSSFGTTAGGSGGFGSTGINIQNNPFLNGALSGQGCGGSSGGCSQSNSVSFQQQSGTANNPAGNPAGSNIDSNPFLSGLNKPTGGSIHISGSSTIGGCGGGSCGGDKQVTTNFEQQQVTNGFAGGFQEQQQVTGFGQQPSGCGGAGCGSQTPTQTQITTGFGQGPTGCGGAGCGQQTTTGVQHVQSSCSGPFCGQSQQTQQNFPQKPQQGFPQQTPQGTPQQTPQGFPQQGFNQKPVSNKPGSGSSLPHPPGVAGAGFKDTGNSNGELTITCIGEGNICVNKNLCLNGFVNDDGTNILQVRSAIRCQISTEVCCRIKPRPVESTAQTFTSNYQSTTGQKVQSASQITTGSGLIHVPGIPGEKAFTQSYNQQNTFQDNQISGKPSNEVRPPFTSSGGYKDSEPAGSQQQFTRPNFGNSDKPGTPYLPPVDEKTPKPYEYPEPENPYNPPVPTFPAQPPTPYQPQPTPYKPQPTPYKPQPTPYQPQPTPYQPQPTPYKPQPTPYKPQPTPYQPQPTPYQPQPTPYKPQPTPYQPQPTPYKPQPTPYQPQPTPYQPQPTPYKPQPTPYQPQPTPYVPSPTPYKPQPTPYKPQPTPAAPAPTPYVPKPTPYVPSAPKPTKGPGYLPPIDDESPQSSIGSQQIVPRPGDSEGGTILDETRDRPRPVPEAVPIVPSGCAAALKCTPKEFCTADGIISNSSVRLTKEQEEFRVPLTDCKEPSTGVVGKCCRDPTYTDPWPTNQLGQWIPGAFGDTGAYKADQNRGKPVRGPNGSNQRNNDNRRPLYNGLGLNPAGSINNPIYAANPNQVTPVKPPQYPSNQATPNNPAVQLQNPVNPAGYPNEEQFNKKNPSYPSGSRVNPGKQVYPNNPIANPNYPTGPGSTNGFPDINPVSKVNTENINDGGLLLGNFANAKQQNQQETCGVRKGGSRPYGNKELFETDFGEIPWQAMILLQTNRTLLCGGVITSENVIVTSAHCVDGLDAKNVLVKGGEYKLGIDEEPRPFQIVQVAKIHKHPQYFTGSLLNDFAVLILSEKLRLAPHIAPICLPPANQDVNQRLYQNGGRYKCITTGWGKQVLQVNIPNSIIHSVDMNLISPPQCQAQIQQNYPHLLENYDANTCICGQPAQQSASVCKVDIGSALACTNGDGTYYMEGVYSWDSGCGSTNQLASFFKFDAFWYQSVFEGNNFQSGLFQQQQIGNSGFLNAGNLQAANQQQQAGYNGQIKQTVTKHGQSFAVSGQKAFEQAIGGHIHTGGQCQCFEDGK